MISFDRKSFFSLKKKFTVKSISQLLEDYIFEAKNINNLEVSEISSLENIKNNSIIFYNSSAGRFNNKSNKILL